MMVHYAPPLAQFPSRNRRLLALFLLVGATLSAGCSGAGTFVPVKGSVRVDGKPASGAIIVFHPEGGDINSIPASGIAGTDGAFTLSTGDRSGVPVGNYLVSVIWPDTSKKPTEQELMMGLGNDGPDQLEGKYATPQNSQLRVEVKASEIELPPLELKTGP